ncbi:preprotein translocase subunit SecY [Buchnera aphidicola]|uniref:preprotein translocase subunit SecY n=1 Tax=Buchnera aphidicola TaxID=9 RepID=UPI0031B8022D
MINKIQRKFKNISSTLLEVKQRIILLIFVIIIFRIGLFVPIPGINYFVVLNFLQLQKGNIFDLFNMFSGGALSHASIFSLGITPYISASIIMQLLTLKKKNLFHTKIDEQKKKKHSQYIRYITLLISVLQSIGISYALPHIDGISGLIKDFNVRFVLTTIISLSTGTMIVMWLGELVTAFGIGNGISMIVFLGIISKFPISILHAMNFFWLKSFAFLYIILILSVIFFITFFIVFIESSYRKVNLYYSKQRYVNTVYMTHNTHLPLKLNMSGIIPSILASSVVIFLFMLCTYLSNYVHSNILLNIIYYMHPGHILYIFFYCFLVIFFCYIYSFSVCNSRDIAENLKRSGVLIPGIRPGLQTSSYIGGIIKRLILINAIYIIFIYFFSDILKLIVHVPFYFGGTSLLILVVVIIEFMTQFQTLMISNKYNSILKKFPLSKHNLY